MADVIEREQVNGRVIYRINGETALSPLQLYDLFLWLLDNQDLFEADARMEREDSGEQ